MTHFMNVPTRVLFGAGCVRELPAELHRTGATRPLLVADRGLVGAGLVRRVAGVLEAAGLRLHLFERVDSNPVERNIWDGVEAYRSAGCDSIVGLGGGSPLDAAKAIRLMAHHPPPMSRYEESRGGERHVTAHVPPLVAVPTTAGTGSEMAPTSVIVLEDTGRKTTLASPHLLPQAALLDPELTQDLPPFITAATGMDALTHNIEAYVARGNHPFADALAIAGIQRIGRFLLRAVKSGRSDPEAREQMLLASGMGAVAFQKGLGAAHALAHALSPVAGLHHGHANALVLPAVMSFNREAAMERLAEVAVALGYDARARPVERAAAAVELVRQLREACGLTGGLSDHGVRTDMGPAIVAKAMEDPCRLTNPRPCGPGDFHALLQAAW